LADTVRIPIDLRNPGITGDGGNAFFNVIALTVATPDFDLGHWEFIKDVDGSVYGLVSIPPTIGGTPAAKIILTLAANATTGVTSIDVETRPVASDAQILDIALDSTIAIQDITMPTTAFHTKEASFTVPTSGNDHPVVAKDVFLIRILHNGVKAADTLAVNTLMVRAELEIDLS